MDAMRRTKNAALDAAGRTARLHRSQSQVFRNDSALTWLFLYRLLLTALLVLFFSYPQETPWLGTAESAQIARLILGLQALSILFGGLLMFASWPTREQQIQLAIFLDIGLYTLLMHLAGGVATGLGLLPAIAVVAGAILMEGRLSLLFASLATLAVITQQLVSELHLDAQGGTYTQAGLLGLTYFAVALLAHVMTRRLRESERLAARRKVDIADLSKLNEYIIQEMSIGMIAVDGDRKLILINNAARRLINAPEAASGDDLFRRVPALHAWFVAALKRQPWNAASLEAPLRLGDAEVIPSLTLLGFGRSHGALIYLRDSAELARQTQEMQLAALGRLTASIAHNIRNPLSSVLQAAQLLAESESVDDADTNLLAIIRRNALRIDETVTSVLELSRRQATHSAEFDLVGWLQTFRDEYCDGDPDRAAQLRVVAPQAPLTISADRRHLLQILRNLCDNAFKHSGGADKPPSVTLVAGEAPATDLPYLDVADAGPGVAESERGRIFEPFYTTSASGTGLGLYIARELAAANDMRLEYIEGQAGGACFRLTFRTSSVAPG
jgi:two-component system sensor histidine kinase PilS (NtrC family)